MRLVHRHDGPDAVERLRDEEALVGVEEHPDHAHPPDRRTLDHQRDQPVGRRRERGDGLGDEGLGDLVARKGLVGERLRPLRPELVEQLLAVREGHDARVGHGLFDGDLARAVGRLVLLVAGDVDGQLRAGDRGAGVVGHVDRVDVRRGRRGPEYGIRRRVERYDDRALLPTPGDEPSGMGREEQLFPDGVGPQGARVETVRLAARHGRR